MKDRVTIRKLDINESPFRFECWAVLNKKEQVMAYCMRREVAEALRIMAEMSNLG